MSRWAAILVLSAALPVYAQTAPQQQDTAKPQDKKQPELKRDRTPPTSDKEEVPPEEDTSLTRDDYSFNPLQSQRDVIVGDEYRKKGNFKAAANRYRTATMRNEGNSDAWLKLAEARQKLKDKDGAREAYSKFLELAPDSKKAEEVRK